MVPSLFLTTRDVKLWKSTKSKTGYWCIVGPLHGKFYVKKKLDAVKGSKKAKLFAGQPSAREAAIALAEYEAQPYELPEKLKGRERKNIVFSLFYFESQKHTVLSVFMWYPHCF